MVDALALCKAKGRTGSIGEVPILVKTSGDLHHVATFSDHYKAYHVRIGIDLLMYS